MFLLVELHILRKLVPYSTLITKTMDLWNLFKKIYRDYVELILIRMLWDLCLLILRYCYSSIILFLLQMMASAFIQKSVKSRVPLVQLASLGWCKNSLDKQVASCHLEEEGSLGPPNTKPGLPFPAGIRQHNSPQRMLCLVVHRWQNHQMLWFNGAVQTSSVPHDVLRDLEDLQWPKGCNFLHQPRSYNPLLSHHWCSLS